MKRGLRTEVMFNITLLAIFSLLLSAVVTFKLLETPILVQQLENFRYLGSLMERHAESLWGEHPLAQEPGPDLEALATSLRSSYQLEGVAILNVRGKVLASNGFESLSGESRLQETLKQEALQAAIGEETVVTLESPLRSAFTQRYSVLLSIPVREGRRIWGAVVCRAAVQSVFGKSKSTVQYFMMYMLLVTLVLAGFGSVLMSRLIVTPLLQLVAVARRLEMGEWNAKASVDSETEVGELASAFNQMGGELGRAIQERDQNLNLLREANDQLTQAQSELVRTEKLATVGRLAAGVAHEIGNPVGAILGYAELIKSDSSTSPETKDYAQRVASEAQRIDRIIRDLLGLAKPQDRSLNPIWVQESIAEVVKLMTGQGVLSGIEVRTSGPEVQIVGDPHDFRQILVNLFTNAALAMRGNGQLTVQWESGIFNEYKDLPVFAGSRQLPFDAASPVVAVRCLDTGPGIDPGILPTIFDPFVTTREPGKGSGLGLYLVSGIMESMRGIVSVRNRPDLGTEFILLFPQAEAI